MSRAKRLYDNLRQVVRLPVLVRQIQESLGANIRKVGAASGSP